MGHQKSIRSSHRGDVKKSRRTTALKAVHTTTMFKNISRDMRQSGTRKIRVLVMSFD
jgi:hypothetical protein